MEIRQLRETDLDAAMDLVRAAGWNQTEDDWRRLLERFHETCFGGWVSGDLVATSTLASYQDRLGWVGMVLVDEAHRGRGYGSAIFEAALDAGMEAGLDVIGLDATDAGRRVYDRYGFERTAGISRWRGTLDLSTPEGVVEFERPDRVAAFDAAHCGVDRTPLLGQLLESESVTGLLNVRHGDTIGYAVVRPGRICHQVGPVVADDRDALERLLGAVTTYVDDQVVLDALRNGWVTEALETAGLDVSRRLHRMTHEERRPALDGEGVVAATGFEWG